MPVLSPGSDGSDGSDVQVLNPGYVCFYQRHARMAAGSGNLGQGHRGGGAHAELPSREVWRRGRTGCAYVPACVCICAEYVESGTDRVYVPTEPRRAVWY
eukprot:3449333-Rhodomonas_salina.4